MIDESERARSPEVTGSPDEIALEMMRPAGSRVGAKEAILVDPLWKR